MANQGECPKCGKRVLHVRIENVVGTVGDESSGRCLSYSCIHCNAVLGVQVDPRAKARPKRKPAAS
jgi:DNA-directed RNA polymerase subunit RPC12/RpoP